MDRFDLENKIMNASLVINDLEALAADMDENPKVSAEVADYYALALLGLAKLCEARFSAVDRVFEYLIPQLDAADKDHKRILEVQKMFEELDNKEKEEKLNSSQAPAVFYQDNDKALWSKEVL